jgi:hypothetical protein
LIFWASPVLAPFVGGLNLLGMNTGVVTARRTVT